MQMTTVPESAHPHAPAVPLPGMDDASAHGALLDDRRLQQRIDDACTRACSAIAPAWPLDRAIAVNPHWSRIGRSVRAVAARMAVLAGIPVFPSRDYIREAWQSGALSAADLDAARALQPSGGPDAAACIAALEQPAALPRLPLLIDVLDDDPSRHERLSWRQAITHQVSQTCAAYFDEHQADWQPERAGGLYAFWRDTLSHDHGIGVLMGLPDLSRRLHALPADRAQAERWVLERLGLPEHVWADYLESVLLTVNGWASWCAYLGWEAAQRGEQDPHLRDLLAIRLAWGALLLEGKADEAAQRSFATVQAAWARAPLALAQAEEALRIDEVWQAALDARYQRLLALRLGSASSPRALEGVAVRPEVQAAFCIDVRSEPMRRALEAVWPGIRTLGFAGFFGLPIAYTPLATDARRPQLPGLLAPAIEVSDRIEGAGAQTGPAHDLDRAAGAARGRQFAGQRSWRAASRWPGAAFSFVEAAGVSYVGKLARWLRPSRAARTRDHLDGLPSRYRALCRPALAGLDLDSRTALAARVLRAMGLERELAPLVLLIGHGSQSANNAHAAALDCGACCGQTGEVNARALARLLNDAEVRAALVQRGLDLPPDTVFVAGLHNTTTDEIEGFDLDLLPAEAQARWNALAPVFAQAGDQVRRERAPRLGLDPRTGHGELLAQLRRRANDGAQTRPEWGLAGNAAFIIASRARSESVVLDGRTFLHDYDSASDPDGSLLELLMTAPMLVTHWINWQYHASTCAPDHFGSGNKLLHNVVGGRIGVFEGNGGDLRVGLSRQSLHDGERWVHAPVRLTVAIDAPAAAIERVLATHAVVRQLVDHGWLHLWRFDGARLLRYDAGQWQDLPFNDAAAPAASAPTVQ